MVLSVLASISSAILVLIATPLMGAPAAPAPAAAPAAADPLQPVKDAILRAVALARRGGPAEKSQPGAPAVDRFICALSEPNDEVSWPLFKQISLDAPKEAWGEIGMGHVYVRWHLRDQAEHAFARALAIDPQNPVALVERAIGARTFGDTAAAKMQVEQILARDPNDARARLLVAQLSEDANAPVQEQQANYQHAIDSSSDLYEARHWMAGVAEKSGDNAAALEATEALAQMNPRDLATQRKLGALKHATGDEAGAAQAYEAAVALGDTNKETWAGLAAAKRALKDNAGEEQALRRWRRIDPKDRAVIVRLFNLRAQARDEAGMEEQARALLALDPKDSGAHLVLASVKGTHHDYLGKMDELNAAISGNVHPEAKTAPDLARTELVALRAKLEIPEKPLLAANPDGVYRVTSRHLTALYEERRKEKPDLRGNLSVQLKINASGAADSVEVTEDTLKDPEISQRLVAAMREGEWPKAKKTLTLKYELAPPGTHEMAASANDSAPTPKSAPRKKRLAKPAPETPKARPSSVGGLGL
jgi:Tfp pilus assembly protein PilF